MVALGIVLALVALVGVGLWLALRRHPAEPFALALHELGLVTGRGDADLPTHGTGELDGVRVFAGMCGARKGRKGKPDEPPRILLLAETGVLPGGRWGVDLSGPAPKPWGREGAGREDVEALMGPDVLEAAAAVPKAALVPGDQLGGMLDRGVRGRWPDGWDGLAARAFLPPDTDAAGILAAFQRLLALRAALRTAAEVAEATEETAGG